MTQPELIIFDCDGVLVDTEGFVSQSLVETLTNYDIHMTQAEALDKYEGLSSASVVTDIETRYSTKLPDSFRTEKALRWRQLCTEGLVATPGVLNLVASLSLKKCVASGSMLASLRHSLGLVGLYDSFAPHIFSSEQVRNGKPAPDVFLFAAKQMETHPSACLVIEDSIAGVRAAKAAGMRVYGFTGWKHRQKEHGEHLLQEGAEAVFSHMDHLAEVLCNKQMYQGKTT